MKKTFFILAMTISTMLLSCNSNNGEENNNSGNDSNGTIYGHEYVDLGLPSGLKWATCNIGAKTPEDYGEYFAWGETSPKAEYTEENSLTYGKYFDDISADPEYDVARASWGGEWRMPTLDEINELIEHCNWQYVNYNGVCGAKVTGPNGKKIFLPAAGIRCDATIYDEGDCYYWSSTPGYYYCIEFLDCSGYCDDCNRSAFDLCFTEDNRCYTSHGPDYNGRGGGQFVRPVIFTW